MAADRRQGPPRTGRGEGATVVLFIAIVLYAAAIVALAHALARE